MNKRDADRRDFALRELGCVVCHIRGVGTVIAEKHHLLTTGFHGNGKRRGEQATVGLCSWHHRGVAPSGWNKVEARMRFGASYAEQPREFRRLYPDAVLEAKQQQLLSAYNRDLIQ